MRRDMRRDYGRGFSRRDGAKLVGRPRDRMRDRNDYQRDMRRDYRPNDYYYEDYRRDYASDNYDSMLMELTDELKRKDRFGMTKDQVIGQAKQFGVRFDNYDEDEFYLTYLMMCCDYKDITNDPMMFIKMAKAFLEDDDISVSPSEKLEIYISEIVYGE